MLVCEYDPVWPDRFAALAARAHAALGNLVLRVEHVGSTAVPGLAGIAGREAFRWPPDETRHHLYVLSASADELLRHVAFRDALRANPGLRDEYAALKRSLAAQFPHDRGAYTEGKSAFIVETLRALGR